MEKTNWFREHGMILLTGVVIGIAALVLTAHGNPGNMGFCIACFLRDIAGAIGLHSAGKVQYVRPEIIGLVLGSLCAALAAKEFRARAGSSPAVRFLLDHDMDWVACNSGERRRLLKKGGFRFGRVVKEPFHLERVLTDLSFMHGEGLHFDELPERYVMMIPGCSPSHPYKRWPVENFCALARRLAERGISSVVIGTRAEAAEVEAIAASSPLAVSFLGKSTLMDIPQMALRSLACVGNDTGPTHMCAYAGVPVTAIFCHRTRKSAITARCISNLISPGSIEEITVDQAWSTLEPFLPPQEELEPAKMAATPQAS